MRKMPRWYVIVREPDKSIIVDDFPDGEDPTDFIRKHHNSKIFYGPFWEETKAVKEALKMEQARSPK